MREIAILQFEASADEWADEYGLPADEAPADFADMIRRNVADPGIVEAVENIWPAMRGNVSAVMPHALDDVQRRALLDRLIGAGLDFSTCVSAFASRQDDSGGWIGAAQMQHGQDGVVEIDDNAIVSHGDDKGAYVMAWVWVDDTDRIPT